MEELVEISTNLVSSRFFFFAYKYLKWLGYVGRGGGIEEFLEIE